MAVSKKAPVIGTLNEGALHAALKQHYGGAEAQFEVPFSGFVADVVRDGTIFEIQTSSFSGLERKMRALADQSPVVLVHPIAAQKNSGAHQRSRQRRLYSAQIAEERQALSHS